MSSVFVGGGDGAFCGCLPPSSPPLNSPSRRLLMFLRRVLTRRQGARSRRVRARRSTRDGSGPPFPRVGARRRRGRGGGRRREEEEGGERGRKKDEDSPARAAVGRTVAVGCGEGARGRDADGIEASAVTARAVGAGDRARRGRDRTKQRGRVCLSLHTPQNFARPPGKQLLTLGGEAGAGEEGHGC